MPMKDLNLRKQSRCFVCSLLATSGNPWKLLLGNGRPEEKNGTLTKTLHFEESKRFSRNSAEERDSIQALLPAPSGRGRTLPWKRCAGCGGKIADRFLLYAMDSYWHSRCLKCSCCQAQLGEIGTSCYTKSGMILCRNDYIRLFGNSGACSACGQSIPASELVMRAQGNVYHLKCFTCSTCRNRLVPGDRFHYINGSLFCEHDRPTALINGHLNSLQTNPLMPDQKVC
ncbi:hypothetical protein GJAV_G00111150 [Gymnothorax javanicus]|nr:hypothetical protein GJAV_G00111150 [Gymnothorax javanicus]